MQELDGIALEYLQAPAGPQVELQWLDDALAGGRRAVFWQGTQGLSAPRSYRRHASLDRVCEEFAARGWPVTLRRSGGGVVPQGPGLLNLSFTFRVDGAPGDLAGRVYRQLCDLLSGALATLGIEALTRAVEGSFCDGRYNLAVDERKIAGTAQYWRRSGGRQAVLAHALLLVDADVESLTERANAFEAALGSGRRYRADALTTVATESGDRSPDLSNRLFRSLAGTLAATNS